MLNVLKKLCKEQKYASIYTDSENSNKFIYGQILAVDMDYIAIGMISPDGISDGIVVQPTGRVIRVEIGGQYDRKMQKLIMFHNSKSDQYAFENGKILESVLRIAQQTKRVVSIEILNSGYDDIAGFVDEIENHFCAVRQIDAYGCEDGVSYVQMSDITQVSYDSVDEKKIMMLWSLNQ